MNRVNGAAAPVGDGVNAPAAGETSVVRKELPAELLEKLRAPLPPEAVSPNPQRPGLSAIKVIYVVERLNEVFGVNGWHMANEVVEKGTMVVVRGALTIEEYGIRIEQYGGNANPDRGDAYKGACTDALSKCASYLGIGMDVYKGLHDQPSGDRRKPEVTGRTGSADKAVASLTTKNMAGRLSGMRTVLGGEEYEAVLERFGLNDMTAPDLGRVREAYGALLDAFRARYREVRRQLGEASYRRILDELRFRPTWWLRPEQAARVFERMKEMLNGNS
jgi:hypothetical protein